MNAGRPEDSAEPSRAVHEEGAVGGARRRPRELYSAAPPTGSGAPLESTSRDTPFRGEFEQRARGPEGTGQAGGFGSDESVRDQLVRRIADDPRMAGTQIVVAVDAHLVTLSGDIAEPAVRDCLLELARGLGIAEVRDLLHVVGTPAPDQQ